MAKSIIQVPTELGDRLAWLADQRGITPAAFLGGLLDNYERQQRFTEAREAYDATQADRWAGTDSWVAVDADGDD